MTSKAASKAASKAPSKAASKAVYGNVRQDVRALALRKIDTTRHHTYVSIRLHT
jgi:hypothetical protein